jgi:MOSC domain-containing protein YiiM
MSFQALLTNHPQVGEVINMGIRPARRVPLQIVAEVEAIQGKGLAGDRYQSHGSRQVTLIQQENLVAVASYLKIPEVDFLLTRRNILVRGINLLSLKGRPFKIGQAVLEYSGECHPCSRMEEALGVGGYHAMRGHGGITARIITTGVIRIGDPIAVIS